MRDRLTREQAQFQALSREYVLNKWGDYFENVNPDGDHKNLHSMSTDIFSACGGKPYPDRDNFSVELPLLFGKKYSIMLNARNMHDIVHVMENSPENGISTYFIHLDKVIKRPSSGPTQELKPQEVGELTRNLHSAFKLTSTPKPQSRSQS